MSYSPTFFGSHRYKSHSALEGPVALGMRGLDGSGPGVSPSIGLLSTNAKKVTVSVLYWYEKLSSLLTEIFKRF